MEINPGQPWGVVWYHTIYRDGDIQCIFVSPYQDVSECMTWPLFALFDASVFASQISVGAVHTTNNHPEHHEALYQLGRIRCGDAKKYS